MSNPAQHFVYRYFDVVGQLLYVGISAAPGMRLQQHAGEHWRWFDEVATITLERYPTRLAAESAERDIIYKENPLHNKRRWNGNGRIQKNYCSASSRAMGLREAQLFDRDVRRALSECKHNRVSACQ